MSEAFEWQSWVEYSTGDIVTFEGIRYKVVQPHKSEPNWTPPATPALWSRLPEEPHKREIKEKPWNEHSVQQVDIHKEEHQKHWYDLDDHRKKELEIGGGFAVGLAALAGGYYAYKHHQKPAEEQKATIWGLQTWLLEAQARTAEYHKNGLASGAVAWVLVHGQNIPAQAIVGGEEDGKALYIARAFQEGGLHPGKAGRHLDKGASIPFGGEEISLDTYEVLVGESTSTQWVSASKTLSVQSLSAKVVEGGREKDGSALYIAQCYVEGSIHPGKAGPNIPGASVSWGGSELTIEEYKVLCYAY